MGSGAADIADIISDVRERLPDVTPPRLDNPDQARFRLFDSITSGLSLPQLGQFIGTLGSTEGMGEILNI